VFFTQHLGNPIPPSAVHQARQPVPGCGRAVRRHPRDPRGALRQRRPQAGGDAPYLEQATSPGWWRSGCAAVPVGVRRLGPRRWQARSAQLRLGQGRPARERLLLLPADPDVGPGFSNRCSYFPEPAKVWVNGQEWANASRPRGLGVTALANGLAAGDHPVRLQAICDRPGPADLQAFFDRWLAPIPPRSAWPIRQPGTGGNCRCARSRPPARWCWTSPAGRGRSLRPCRRQPRLGRPEEVKLIFDAASTTTPWELGHQGRPPPGGGGRQRLLPPLPQQAIPQGRPGAAGRDGGQLTH
jgi:hypothetical protein